MSIQLAKVQQKNDNSSANNTKADLSTPVLDEVFAGRFLMGFVDGQNEERVDPLELNFAAAKELGVQFTAKIANLYKDQNEQAYEAVPDCTQRPDLVFVQRVLLTMSVFIELCVVRNCPENIISYQVDTALEGTVITLFVLAAVVALWSCSTNWYTALCSRKHRKVEKNLLEKEKKIFTALLESLEFSQEPRVQLALKKLQSPTTVTIKIAWLWRPRVLFKVLPLSIVVLGTRIYEELSYHREAELVVYRTGTVVIGVCALLTCMQALEFGLYRAPAALNKPATPQRQYKIAISHCWEGREESEVEEKMTNLFTTLNLNKENCYADVTSDICGADATGVYNNASKHILLLTQGTLSELRPMRAELQKVQLNFVLSLLVSAAVGLLSFHLTCYDPITVGALSGFLCWLWLRLIVNYAMLSRRAWQVVLQREGTRLWIRSELLAVAEGNKASFTTCFAEDGVEVLRIRHSKHNPFSRAILAFVDVASAAFSQQTLSVRSPTESLRCTNMACEYEYDAGWLSYFMSQSPFVPLLRDPLQAKATRKVPAAAHFCCGYLFIPRGYWGIPSSKHLVLSNQTDETEKIIVTAETAKASGHGRSRTPSKGRSGSKVDDLKGSSSSLTPTPPAPTSPAPTSPAPTSPAPNSTNSAGDSTAPAPTSPVPTSPAPTSPAPNSTNSASDSTAPAPTLPVPTSKENASASIVSDGSTLAGDETSTTSARVDVFDVLEKGWIKIQGVKADLPVAAATNSWAKKVNSKPNCADFDGEMFVRRLLNKAITEDSMVRSVLQDLPSNAFDQGTVLQMLDDLSKLLNTK